MPPLNTAPNSAIPQPIPTQTFLQGDINSQSQQQPTVTPNKPAGNFFTRLLPTAGGILGGIVGIPGDLFSGGISSAAGAGLGATLGQELENKLTGTKTNPLESGALNAVGAGVGAGLGKAVSALGSRVVAPLAEKGAFGTFGAQAPGITKSLSKYMVQDNGFNDAKQASQFADVITGPAGGRNLDVDGKAEVNKFVEDTLNNQGPQNIDVSDLHMGKLTGKNAALGESVASETNTLQQLIDKNYLNGTPQANGIRQQVNAIFNGIKSDNPQGTVGSLDALNAQRQVASLADDAYAAAEKNRDSTMLNVAKTFNGLSDELKSRLNLGGIAVAPEDAEALASNVEKFGNPINTKAASGVANEIRQASQGGGLTLNGLRNLESNWVQIKNAVSDAENMAEKNFGTSGMDIARATLPIAGSIAGAGGKRSAAGATLGFLSASPQMDAAMSSALSKTADIGKGKVVQKVLPSLIRATSIGAANLPDIVAQGGQTATPTQAVSDNINSGVNSLNQSPLQEAFQIAQAGAGVTPGSAQLLSSLTPDVQKQQLAESLINSLIPSYFNAGGPQGLGGGLLSSLTGLIPGTAANTFNRQRAATSGALAQLLGISPAAAGGAMPTLMQTPQAAMPQIGNLQNILGSIAY